MTLCIRRPPPRPLPAAGRANAAPPRATSRSACNSSSSSSRSSTACSRRLLPADRARAVADLLARRHRQSGARRVLCDRRLSHAYLLADRIGFAGTFVAAPVLVGLLGIVIERLLFRRFYRADPILSLLLTFGLAMVAEQGLRMIFGASPLALCDARLAARPALPRRLHLSEEPPDDAGGRGGRRDAHLAPDLPHAVRPRGARRRAEPRDGRRARHLARALHDGDRRASASASPALPACCSRRSSPSIPRWGRRSSPPPSWWW